MEKLSVSLSNLIGFVMLIVVGMCFFKSTRKMLLKLLKYIWDRIELREVIKGLIKRFWHEIKTGKEIIQNKKERYMYLACTAISFIYLLYRFGFNYTLLWSFFTYFIFKGLTKEIREYFVKIKVNKLTAKYKDIVKLFDGKIKVMEVNRNSITLNSFIPVEEIKKKKGMIEHFLNREIESIKRDVKKFRIINIKFKHKDKINLDRFFYFEDYIINAKRDNSEIMFTTGIDSNGKILIFDLVKLTHCFIAGMQGGGKSNLLNVIIQSMMYFNDNVFFIMVDFKSVELCQYEEFKNTVFIERLDNNFLNKLNELEAEMDLRYQKLKKEKVKKISQYNQKAKEKLSYIVLIIDEMSDIGLCKDTNLKDSIEDILTRIMNKGRAAGILVIGATQRPAATQINTNIRDRFGTKFSARIKDKNTQRMAGIQGTENLKDGEFLMEYIEEITKFKAFFIDELKNNKVYENLSKSLSGGVNLDKYI